MLRQAPAGSFRFEQYDAAVSNQRRAMTVWPQAAAISALQ
jgi:hypothetical protein